MSCVFRLAPFVRDSKRSSGDASHSRRGSISYSGDISRRQDSVSSGIISRKRDSTSSSKGTCRTRDSTNSSGDIYRRGHCRSTSADEFAPQRGRGEIIIESVETGQNDSTVEVQLAREKERPEDEAYPPLKHDARRQHLGFPFINKVRSVGSFVKSSSVNFGIKEQTPSKGQERVRRSYSNRFASRDDQSSMYDSKEEVDIIISPTRSLKENKADDDSIASGNTDTTGSSNFKDPAVTPVPFAGDNAECDGLQNTPSDLQSKPAHDENESNEKQAGSMKKKQPEVRFCANTIGNEANKTNNPKFSCRRCRKKKPVGLKNKPIDDSAELVSLTTHTMNTQQMLQMFTDGCVQFTCSCSDSFESGHQNRVHPDAGCIKAHKAKRSARGAVISRRVTLA